MSARGHVESGWCNIPVFGYPEAPAIRRGNADGCRPGLGCRVVQHEIEPARWELPDVKAIQQIEVHQHQFAITHLAESFEHEIHPNAFTRAINLLANVPGLSAEF